MIMQKYIPSFYSEGTIVVTELNLTRRTGSRRLKLINEHRGALVGPLYGSILIILLCWKFRIGYRGGRFWLLVWVSSIPFWHEHYPRSLPLMKKEILQFKYKYCTMIHPLSFDFKIFIFMFHFHFWFHFHFHYRFHFHCLQVCDMTWHASTVQYQLYSGDDQGRVLKVSISLNKAKDILQVHS